MKEKKAKQNKNKKEAKHTSPEVIPSRTIEVTEDGRMRLKFHKLPKPLARA